MSGHFDLPTSQLALTLGIHSTPLVTYGTAEGVLLIRVVALCPFPPFPPTIIVLTLCPLCPGGRNKVHSSYHNAEFSFLTFCPSGSRAFWQYSSVVRPPLPLAQMLATLTTSSVCFIAAVADTLSYMLVTFGQYLYYISHLPDTLCWLHADEHGG